MTDDLVKRMRAVERDYDLYDHDLIYEAADRIEELEFVLRFISNINYGNGSDVTMEHQDWARKALGEKKGDR